MRYKNGQTITDVKGFGAAGSDNKSVLTPGTSALNPGKSLLPETKPLTPPGGFFSNPTATPKSGPAPTSSPLTNSDWTRFYSSPEGQVPGMKFVPQPDGTMSFDVSGGPKQINSTPAPAPTPTTSGQPATQPAPQQTAPPAAQPAQQQPAPQQQQPLDAQSIVSKLPENSNISPEQRQAFGSALSESIKGKEGLIAGASALAAGQNTPEAKEFQAHMRNFEKQWLDQQMQKAVQENPAAASTPQGWGDMFGQVSQQWQQMPQEMKWLTGLGIGGGLLGVASSMFGEGGMGMGLLGLLGIGGGLAAGASSGLFGQGAANMTGDAAYQIGSFLGMAPEAQSGSLSDLRGEDAIARMTSAKIDEAAAYKDPAAYASSVQQKLQKAEQIKKLMMIPEAARPQFLKNIDPSLSDEDAVIVSRNAAQFATQMDDPESAVSGMLRRGNNFVANPHAAVNAAADKKIEGYLPGWAAGAAPYIRGAHQYMTGAKTAPKATRKKGASMNINKLVEKWAFNDVDAKELSDLKTQQNHGVSYRVEDARRLNELEKRKMVGPSNMDKKTVIVLCQKAARCWAGYEPVPGAKAYSKGSCRPKGSKKTQKEMKKS